MRAAFFLMLLLGCERAPSQASREAAAWAAQERDRTLQPLPHPLKREHQDIADRMLTALVYLDMDVSEPRIVPDCTAAARVVDLWLRNNDELRAQMTRVIDESSTDAPAHTWLTTQYADKMQHAAHDLLQWADKCAQVPAFRQAFARLPIVSPSRTESSAPP